MNTTAHIIVGVAAFGRPDDRRVTRAAVLGSFLPDLSLYFFVFWQSLVMGRTAEQVFGYDYRAPFWQGVFAVDNSIVLWGGALALAFAFSRPAAVAFAGAGLVHLCFDFLLHHNDARRHFWPISDWVFHSPVSYWDPAHYGRIVGPLEFLASLALGLWLWRRFRGGFARSLIALAVFLEAVPAFVFPIVFASH